MDTKKRECSNESPAFRRGEDQSGVKELRFACGALMLIDVVELIPKAAQQQILLASQRAVQNRAELRHVYNWVAVRDFRNHLVPRSSQLPNSMVDLLPADPVVDAAAYVATTTTEQSDLRLADHCALLLTPYLVQPASVWQCLQEHEGQMVQAGVITTPQGLVV